MAPQEQPETKLSMKSNLVRIQALVLELETQKSTIATLCEKVNNLDNKLSQALLANNKLSNTNKSLESKLQAINDLTSNKKSKPKQPKNATSCKENNFIAHEVPDRGRPIDPPDEFDICHITH